MRIVIAGPPKTGNMWLKCLLGRAYGLRWLRPWLSQDPQAIAAYVRRHRLKHIEDESNDDRRFARNRLRLEVWPALERAFPQAAASLADAAEWARQAARTAPTLDRARSARPWPSRGPTLVARRVFLGAA